MSKSQAARIYSVSLSSVKRYVKNAPPRRIAGPKEWPGSAPNLDEKARKLFKDDLAEHPYLTLQDRCDYIETLTGVSVSRSTMCRAIARICSTTKKGDE